MCLQIVAEGLEGYEVPEADLAGLHSRLDAFARERMETAAREAANTALPRMKERFTEVPCTPPHPACSRLHPSNSGMLVQ